MWKIRHKKTGLFYQPLSDNPSWKRTNLDKVGKLYSEKPDLSRFKKFCIYTKVKDEDGKGYAKVSKTYNFNPDFWEIVRIEDGKEIVDA